ncbi:hypothetical protein DSM112329_01729 [Paraconexibacter sp. AEG42_29]|uniref:Prokaryotic cytochrome C oxidase subunit IV family protein n=1 Tax=Paraconexibacter sp. AEG42_29 TaxID=2997339 RepID=A0AAU7AT71_9ACTN
MSAVVCSPPVVVWFVLVAATVASYVLGVEHGVTDPGALAALLIAIAFVKVALVGRHFMELHAAAPPLRRAFQLYLWIVGGGLVVLAVAL